MKFVIQGPDDEIIFPLNPESITVTNGLQTLDYKVQDLGGISIPSGRDPAKYGWEGIFPGPARANATYINKPYRFPIDLCARLDSWFGIIPGENLVELDLTVTSSSPGDPAPITTVVFLSQWDWRLSGRYGDYNYSIGFTEARHIFIPIDFTESSTDTTVTEDTSAGEDRHVPEPVTEYLVKSGDTLIRIAARELGDASKWQEIFEVNKDPVIPGFTDPNMIQVGWTLRMPVAPAEGA